MTVQEFIAQLSVAVATEVLQKSASAPPKLYAVKRKDAEGRQVQVQVQLPQVIAELTDVMQIVLKQNDALIQQNVAKAKQLDMLTNVMTALIGELEAHRKVGKAMLKQARKSEDDDDDD